MPNVSINVTGFDFKPTTVSMQSTKHIRIKQPRENYTDYTNRNVFPLINVQALCDYRYCFLDAVVKWPGSAHDSRIFLRPIVNNTLKSEVVAKCEKIIVNGEISVPVCILRDPAYPLLSFVMRDYPKRGKDDREKTFGYKLSSERIVTENAFGRLKSGFCCLNRAMDVNAKELPNLIMLCFVLHTFCRFRHEKFPIGCSQNARVEDKLLQPDCQRMKYEHVVNESSAKEIKQLFSMYFE